MVIDNKIQFRPGPLAGPLSARADKTNPMNLSIDLVAKRDLTRYYQVLEDSMPELTFGQAGWIVDILNSTVMDERTYRYLFVEIKDSIEDGLAEKWQVNGPDFVALVGLWMPAQRMAVIDAAERYWRMEDGTEDRKEALLAAGFKLAEEA